MRAEGRGSSAEASPSRKGSRKLMFSESLALNMQVEPAMYVYVSSQLFNHNLEALNQATKLKCFQEHVFLGLGTILASNPRSISGHTTFAEAPRKVRERSAEARRSTLDPYPCLCFRNPFFSPMGNPNELLLVRPHVAATWQLHSYGNDLLSLWPRVASKSQLDLHENLCMNVAAFLKTCHPSAGIFCMCTHNII